MGCLFFFKHSPKILVLFALWGFETNNGMETPDGCIGEDIPLDELWENAYSFGKSGQFNEARLCFERYAIRDASKDKSWCLLSEIHARMGNPQGAVRHASVAARISGHNQSGAEALFLLANGHMATNRFDLARQLYYRHYTSKHDALAFLIPSPIPPSLCTSTIDIASFYLPIRHCLFFVVLSSNLGGQGDSGGPGARELDGESWCCAGEQ